MRAAGNALGWLRAFSDKGVLGKARYVSVNSGASWVTLIAIFAAAAKMHSSEQPISFSNAIHDLLHLSGPKDLADAKFLKRVRQGFRSTMSKNNREYYLKALSFFGITETVDMSDKLDSNQNFWCRAVKEFMMAHEQIDPPYISADDNFDESVKKQLPFFIVAGSIMLTKIIRGIIRNTEEHYCLPFEFTPTYCGVPVYDTTDSNTPAGFIEPFAFNCNYENDKGVAVTTDYNLVNKKELFIKRKDPENMVYMSDVSGISSSAIVQGFYEIVKAGQSFFVTAATSILNTFSTVDSVMNDVIPKFQFWAPKKQTNSDSYVLNGGEYKFSDGGTFDNTASLNLIRRGVKNIAICYSNTQDVFTISNKGVWETEAFEATHPDFMALFGLRKVQSGENSAWVKSYNVWRKVFDAKVWDAIKEELKKSAQSSPKSSAVVYLKDVQVLNNEYAGVRNYKANILFVFNDKASPRWAHFNDYNKAPVPSTDTKTYFEAKDFENDFPFISYMYMSYTESLTDKLVSNTHFNLINNPKLDAFLKDATSTQP